MSESALKKQRVESLMSTSDSKETKQSGSVPAAGRGFEAAVLDRESLWLCPNCETENGSDQVPHLQPADRSAACAIANRSFVPHAASSPVLRLNSPRRQLLHIVRASHCLCAIVQGSDLLHVQARLRASAATVGKPKLQANGSAATAVNCTTQQCASACNRARRSESLRKKFSLLNNGQRISLPSNSAASRLSFRFGWRNRLFLVAGWCKLCKKSCPQRLRSF